MAHAGHGIRPAGLRLLGHGTGPPRWKVRLLPRALSCAECDAPRGCKVPGPRVRPAWRSGSTRAACRVLFPHPERPRGPCMRGCGRCFRVRPEPPVGTPDRVMTARQVLRDCCIRSINWMGRRAGHGVGVWRDAARRRVRTRAGRRARSYAGWRFESSACLLFDFLPVRKGQEPRGFRGAHGKPAALKGEECRQAHKFRSTTPRGPYIPEAGKTNPVSHGQCVSVQLLPNQISWPPRACCGKSGLRGRSGGSESLPGRTTLPAPPWRTAACTRPDSARAERE